MSTMSTTKETKSNFLINLENGLKEEISKDARNYGNALNEAAWNFVEVRDIIYHEPLPTYLFNDIKSILRDSILTYIDKVEVDI